jgi:hypothetical protein
MVGMKEVLYPAGILTVGATGTGQRTAQRSATSAV